MFFWANDSLLRLGKRRLHAYAIKGVSRSSDVVRLVLTVDT